MQNMKTVLAFCLVFLGGLFSLSAPVFAQNQVEMPPVGDFVLRFSSPAPSDGNYYHTSSGESLFAASANTYQSAATLARIDVDSTFKITMLVHENPITLADRAAYWQGMDGTLPIKFHETGYSEALGRETLYLYVSPTYVFEDGEFVDADQKDPTGLVYVGLYDDRVILEVEYNRNDEPITEADIAALDAFVKTVSVTYEEFFDSEATTYLYSSPDLMLHLSPEKFVRSQVALEVPRDWIVEETELSEAGPGRQTGQIELDMAPFEDIQPGTAPETFRVMVIGLPDQSLSSAVFHAAGQTEMGKVIQNPAQLSSTDLSENMKEFIFGGHCLSNYKGSPNSGGVKAVTYTGLNSDGAPIKALHVSAGGYYLSCHYLYSASPQRFDQNIEMVFDLIKGIDLEFIGPPLER